jgi:hypothetical protein
MNPTPTKLNRWRPFTVFNLLVGLLFSFSALAQPAFLNEGLVAYYPFNGNANDDSVYNNDGLSFNTVLTPDRFGLVDSAYKFQYTELSAITTKTNNLPPGANPRTVSVWYKQSSRINGDFLRAPLFSVTDLTSGDYFILTFWGPSLEAKQSYQGKYAGYKAYDGLKQPMIDQKWHQLTAVIKSSGISVYIDGNPTVWNDLPLPGTQWNIPEGDLWIGYGQNNYFDGILDDFRIYNRSLSEAEVKAIYDYESTSPVSNFNPRIAKAIAQVVNGFLIGTTIIDGGFGYVSNPVVTITGGGGTGAKATAAQFNGVVTSITITNPGAGYTSTPTITIAPPPFPPRKATSTAQIVNGFVVGTKITDGGFGYDSPPAILLIGGGGSGATAVATVANGVVTAITINNPGTGYTAAPVVRIASPPFAPKLGIETSKVFVRMSVVLGRKYQLEASTDLNSWTTTGPAFIAQDEELVQEFDVNQVGRYFRINQVP